MKVGIITLPLHTNYGGILQAYALQTILQRQGHSVVIYNTPNRFPKTKWSQIPKRIIKKILGRDIVIFREIREKQEAPIVYESVWKFRKNYLNEFVVDNLRDIKEKDVDVLVVGSDQIWRPIYFKTMWRTGIENAYLSFTNKWNVKRYAYAASLGVDTWEMSKEETACVLKNKVYFDGISVREESAINLIKQHLQIEAQHVLDPTMLLNESDYLRLFSSLQSDYSSNTLLTYILDENEEKKILTKRISSEKGLSIVSANQSFVSPNAPLEERVLPSVESWLQKFYQAKMIVTDSFHACVFSILFSKPFIAIGNTERGLSRFSSLLSMFQLERNLISDASEYDSNFDYAVSTEAKELLKKWRERSLDFLRKI